MLVVLISAQKWWPSPPHPRSLLEWDPNDQKRNNCIIKINSNNNELNSLNKIASGKSLQIHIEQLMDIAKVWWRVGYLSFQMIFKYRLMTRG